MGRMSDYQIDQMETPIMDKCPECDGEGSVYYEVARPQSFTRDIGYLEEVVQVCENCSGDGKVVRICEGCPMPVTLGMGHDAEYCEECAND
jgi:DnaJ-class molecular chaperone